MGCCLFRWSCCFLPGNIASNSISRSSGSSRWFIGSQRLSETKPNICIAMHIAVEQGHFQKRSGDVGACKSNDRSNTQAFFLSVFPGIQHILPRFVRFQSSFGAKKTCTCTVQIVIAYSYFLVRGSKAATSRELGICQWSQVNVASPKRISLRKNEPNWDIWNQSRRFFLLEVYHMYRDCEFDMSFVHHFWGDSDVSFKPVLISFKKIRWLFTSYWRAAAIRLDLD